MQTPEYPIVEDEVRHTLYYAEGAYFEAEGYNVLKLKTVRKCNGTFSRINQINLSHWT